MLLMVDVAGVDDVDGQKIVSELTRGEEERMVQKTNNSG
jgi:hypothetical protein